MAREPEPYILSSKEDISLIFTPLKTTKRIKYTCFTVSENFLVLGATSGGLYVFKREPCSFLQLLPNKEGPVAHVSVSPNEKLFAFATAKGAACVLLRNAGAGARLLQVSREHRNAEVTAMQWNTDSNELYISDALGRISVVNIISFTGKHMFHTPTFMLMQLDSRVVQMDWFGSLLLVSTVTRCYICDTYKEEYHQIGQKLRDGEFGTCFLNVGDESVPQQSSTKEKKGKFNFLSLNENSLDCGVLKDVKIFCARPGSRMWEVDIDGSVKNTHEFKNALAIEPACIVNLDDSTVPSSSLAKKWAPQSFNFMKLYVLSKRFLFTFKSDGIYIFDPIKAIVILWNDGFKNIVDCQIYRDIIYLRLSTGEIHSLSFSPIEKILVQLYLRKNYVLCSDLCWRYHDYLVSQVARCSKLHLLLDLEDKLPKNGSDLKILPFLNELSKYYKDKSKCQKLKSGIFLVGNLHAIVNSDDHLGHVLSDEWLGDHKKSRSWSNSPSKYSAGSSIELKKSLSCSSLMDLVKTNEAPFVTSNKVFRLQSEEDVWNTSSVKDDFFNSEFLFPLAGITSPETIKTLKNLSHSVSGKIIESKKSIRKTWHVLEDKVKHFAHESPQEPLDVQPEGFESARHFESDCANNIEDTNILHLKTVPKKFPSLDTQKITDICFSIADIKGRGGDFSVLAVDLFTSVDSLCKEWDMAHANGDKLQSHMENVTASMYYCSDVKPFPFRHYFSNSCVQIIQDLLHESLQSGLLITWLESQSHNVIQTRNTTPEFLQTVHTSASLNLDYLLSNILVVFTELIDSERIVNCVKSSQVPCYYHSLCTILDLCKDGALNADGCQSSEGGKWSLPTLLNAMFCVLQMGQAETCSKMGESVQLKDVLYLILRLQSQSVESGVDSRRALTECQTQFLRYVDNILDDLILVAAFEDPVCCRFILDSFQSLNKATGQSCGCGFPLPNSPLQTTSFPNIWILISNFYWSRDQSQLVKLAGKIPGLWLCTLQLQRTDDTRTLLPILIHVGDVTEFESRSKSFDKVLWAETLQLFVQFRAGICLNCGTADTAVSERHRISWSALGSLMVSSLGAKGAIDLMVKHESDIPPGALDARFYQSCLLATELKKCTPLVRSEALALLNPSAVSCSQPSIHMGNMSPSLLDAINADLRTRKSQSSPVSPARGPTNRSHLLPGPDPLPWGTCIDLSGGNCPCCALPLNLRVLLSDGGITSFRCGHSYHAVCVRHHRNVTCLLCKKI